MPDAEQNMDASPQGEDSSPRLDGPVLIQGGLRASLRSQRQPSSLDIVLMATARQGVVDPEKEGDDSALICLRDLLADARSPKK